MIKHAILYEAFAMFLQKAMRFAMHIVLASNCPNTNMNSMFLIGCLLDYPTSRRRGANCILLSRSCMDGLMVRQ